MAAAHLPADADAGHAPHATYWVTGRPVSHQHFSSEVHDLLTSLRQTVVETKSPCQSPDLQSVFRDVTDADPVNAYVLATTDLDQGDLYNVGMSTLDVEDWACRESRDDVWAAVSLPFDRESPVFDHVRNIASRMKAIRKQRREAFLDAFPLVPNLESLPVIPPATATAEDSALRPYCRFTDGLMLGFLAPIPYDGEDEEYDNDSDVVIMRLEPFYEAEIRCLRKLAGGGRLEEADCEVKLPDHRLDGFKAQFEKYYMRKRVY